ncbi:unnamed protein product [Lampetra planeri]
MWASELPLLAQEAAESAFRPPPLEAHQEVFGQLGSLLVLGRAAYPKMDGAALDSLTLERLLSLARELSVVLAIAEEADLSSLKAIQCIQAHLGLS